MNNNKLNLYYITGFTDAEGCFNVTISPRSNGKYQVSLRFEIDLHSRDIELLSIIQSYFKGVGTLTTTKNKSLVKFQHDSSYNRKSTKIFGPKYSIVIGVCVGPCKHVLETPNNRKIFRSSIDFGKEFKPEGYVFTIILLLVQFQLFILEPLFFYCVK